MTGLELIVAALAAGASAGVTNTASDAVRDSYVALRDLLRRRFADRAAAQQILEAQETEPQFWQARLGVDLEAVGATDDAAILAAAKRLLDETNPSAARSGKYRVEVRESKGVQIGDFSTQTNTFQ